MEMNKMAPIRTNIGPAPVFYTAILRAANTIEDVFKQ